LAEKDVLVHTDELTKHVYVDNDMHYKRGILFEESYIPPSQKM
jgi:hypothetical protein